jgi:hypothetical protein
MWARGILLQNKRARPAKLLVWTFFCSRKSSNAINSNRFNPSLDRIIGLPLFGQRPAAAPAHPVVGDRDEPSREERAEAVKAAARRILDELAAVKERLLRNLDPVRSQILGDPSSLRPDLLDGFVSDGEEIVDGLCALVRASVALEMDLAALQGYHQLEVGLAGAAANLLRSVEQRFARLRQVADIVRVRAIASAARDPERESNSNNGWRLG